jgi:hypothetical protein
MTTLTNDNINKYHPREKSTDELDTSELITTHHTKPQHRANFVFYVTFDTCSEYFYREMAEE